MEFTNSLPMPAVKIDLDSGAMERDPTKYTLADYMRDVVKRATGDGKRDKGNATLRNFIKGHSLVGTLRGSPHWVRNENFYKRNAHA